ncbi:hypothetical protein TSTA_062540 [Talaromyces stipitatus ATCC 10500]|uniref:Uncharacterized protein n=1 Tax=Talaromyces stipitatus (strain ATCC 10500 / CBS 375.48 / QM 6759 / NRRL 1006) TaxID=441959 RepID=B8LXV2_TALSN|nr:uncharacterized protein TSTA_062540 [Talaromyces stipitatus ATCC 10500]EED22767.1 hypothetical protein TSTA_062540 [Talaromyces stipitatus ATCC 10500]
MADHPSQEATQVPSSEGETRQRPKPPTVNYLMRDPLYELEKPYMTTFDTTELGGQDTNYKFTEHNINAQSADHIQNVFDLEINGFQFLQHTTLLSHSDFECDLSIVSRYYPDVVELVKAVRPQVSHVHILSHTRRDASISKDLVVPNRLYQPVTNAHAGGCLNFPASFWDPR